MRRDLAFFAHLEGLRVETLERQFVLSSRETRDICVLEETHVSAIGGSECYGLYKRVEEKWLHLGAPTRMQYRVEVWPVGVRKRAPVNGWLTHRTHSQLLFRLK